MLWFSIKRGGYVMVVVRTIMLTTCFSLASLFYIGSASPRGAILLAQDRPASQDILTEEAVQQHDLINQSAQIVALQKQIDEQRAMILEMRDSQSMTKGVGTAVLAFLGLLSGLQILIQIRPKYSNRRNGE